MNSYFGKVFQARERKFKVDSPLNEQKSTREREIHHPRLLSIIAKTNYVNQSRYLSL
jgi:hypothetical protein